jgi:hypothetical protein
MISPSLNNPPGLKTDRMAVICEAFTSSAVANRPIAVVGALGLVEINYGITDSY